jgi:predicted nucleic acid-binding protein
MTPFVLDASVALSWFFDDEFSPYSDAIGEIMPRIQAVVPIVWPLEMANGFLAAFRRGRLQETQAAALIGAIGRLRIDIDHGIAPESLARATLTLGIAHRLSAYDASYLEVAMRRGLPLATQDERLIRAAVGGWYRNHAAVELRAHTQNRKRGSSRPHHPPVTFAANVSRSSST